MKEFGPRGEGRVPDAPLHPPMLYNIVSFLIPHGYSGSETNLATKQNLLRITIMNRIDR